MERNRGFWNVKLAAVAVIAGFAAAALFYTLDGEIARGCNILHAAGWVVLEVLRPVVVAGWQSVTAHLPDNSGCLQDLPQLWRRSGRCFARLPARV